jgi:hypothetical protein
MLLRGRGRENMMAAPTPEELVRSYDGIGNPIGKAYTRRDVRAMVADHFEILEERRIGFPRRVLPVRVPDGLHRLLARMFGLMIVLRCRKWETAPARVAPAQPIPAPARVEEQTLNV